MKRILLLAGLLLFAPAAMAADNAVTVTVGSGTTMKSKDVGAGVQALQPIISDVTGTPVGTTAVPLVATTNDPCQTVAANYTPITMTTATTLRIVAPASAKRTYICYMLLTSAAADNVGVVEGTGGTCGAGTAGVIGGTTAANGPNFAANGGVSMGNGGFAVAATAGTNVDLCLITSAATPLAGHIKWVQAP